MNKSMAMAGKTMAMMNRQMNLPAIQKMAMQFQQQSGINEMKQEMLDDVIDETMGAEDEEGETDELVDKVMAEVGVSLSEELANAAVPMRSPAQAQAAKGEEVADDELQARLESLRKL